LTTGLTRHGFTPSAKTGKQVLKLGQFHLRFSLAGFRVLAKNVQDDGGAINHFHLDDVF
jgi:hypothetical protein